MEAIDHSRAHYKYRSQLLSTPASRIIKVLMIGNNPHEMGCLSDILRNFMWKKFTVRATFNLREGLRAAYSMGPDYILVDGNLGEVPLKLFVRQLRDKKQTRGAAIALLKDDNSTQLLIPGILDYLLKENIASDTFAYNVLNTISIKLHQDQKSYRRMKRSQLSSWFPKNLGLEENPVAS